MLDTPVLFIIFNRPNTTQRVFESIRATQPSKLYVAADGPRPGNKVDELKCNDARRVIDQVDWPCEVKLLYREKNMGCFYAVSEAINWFFKQEEMGIILEDDCVPSGDFYRFCEQMLHKYRYDKKIISINGSNLGYQLKTGKSYSFSRFMNMWGWATWRREAFSIDYDMASWRSKKYKRLFLFDKLKNSMFDFDVNWYKYWEQKFNYLLSQKQKITWDWQWNYHQIERNQLSIVPGSNLVSNIGFDKDATHTFENNNPASNIPSGNLKFPLVFPTRMQPDLDYEEKFVKWIWCYHKRLPSAVYLQHYIKRKIISFIKGTDNAKKHN